MAVKSVDWMSLQIEGNLIASDLTTDFIAGSYKGQSTVDFGLNASEKLADEIAIAWGDAKAYWSAFQRGLSRLDESDVATSLTREQWVLPLLRSFGYDPFYTSKAEVVDGKTYAISHRAGVRQNNSTQHLSKEKRSTQWEGSYDLGGTADLLNKPPLHIVGCRVGLEERPPSGNPRLSAHALVQEYLNYTDHLWAVVTNGLRWRLLRDCSLMSRLRYVEFDLEQILNSENYSEFSLFYRLFHRSRLPRGMEDADTCLLEFYHQESIQQGGRVRDRLRDGVEEALLAFGNGFLQHRDNQALRQSIESGALTDKVFYRQLLLLIYRLLFLMVAESRDLLLGSELTPAELIEKSRIYREYYSVERLRLFAERPSWRREGFQDMWQGLQITFSLMDENWRGKLLGLSPLNGDLFGSDALKALDSYAIDNHDLLKAIRSLSLYKEKGQLRRISYAALDVEELGSVYESLLDFHPQVSCFQGIYSFQLVTGSDRKTTGSYYTPRELVGQLIKSTLEPVMTERLLGLTTTLQKEQALLSLKVIDPACGSGHFLLAAARRLGLELARIRTTEQEPGDKARRAATRDVVQHCIYGVDLNPLAVDLCKVALWVEGFCQGYPLNFLNHRIKCGHSLVGVMDLAVLHEGIPEGAFKPVAGDSKSLASSLKKRNKKERGAQGQLSAFGTVIEAELPALAQKSQNFGLLPEETTSDVRDKKLSLEQLRQDAQWRSVMTACNLWTAAFFMPLTDQNLQLIPTTELLERFWREQQDDGTGVGSLTPIVEAANQLAQETRFFHWPLEFPEVFGDGGFDCVLGNPPWERIKLQEKEFFSILDPEIANAANKAARERLIKALPSTKPEISEAFASAKHGAEALSKYVRESGRFALTAVGDVNTYSIFSETARHLIAEKGRAGIIVPTGIATDDTCKRFFGDLIKNREIASLYDFENREKLFEAVDSRMKFSLLSMSGTQIQKAKFSFFSTQVRHLENPSRMFHLTPDDIALINPNTLTCPIFRTRFDAELTKKIYQRVPVLENERTGQNPWGISFSAMFHMSNDSGLFATEPGNESVPLYEAKMLHQFDHRWATYTPSGKTRDMTDIEKQDPNCLPVPRYWVERSEVEDRLAHKWDRNWLIAFRDITNSTNERTAIFSILPRVGINHKAPILLTEKSTHLNVCLLGNLDSLILDFVARQKVGGTSLSFFILRQLPILVPESYSQANIDFIASRILELVYTTDDLQPFAQDMGYVGDPFPWDLERRALLRAELDAYYAYLYGLTRDELRYILDPADLYGDDFPSETFRVLRKNEIKEYGEYRTQRLVLEAWDRLFEDSLKLPTLNQLPENKKLSISRLR